MDCKFFTACHDKKYMPWFNINNINIFWFYLTKYFEDIPTIIYVSYVIFMHITSMCIHIMYINAHIHQGLNPRLHENAPRFSSPKPLQIFDKIKRKLNFIIFDMNLFLK
jgi:hypothetical protein